MIIHQHLRHKVYFEKMTTTIAFARRVRLAIADIPRFLLEWQKRGFSG
jgi:hypothetical protein